jgi:hypothetical protein
MTMEDTDNVVLDPHRRLRAAARTRAERTVARLRVGIQAIQDRHQHVTARTIERETGLTFKTIQRNSAAYELYMAVAHVFGTGRKRGQNRRRTGRTNTPRPPIRDALLAYKKTQLVARLRTALQQIEALEIALAAQAATCQEQHLRTILSLRVDNQRLEAQRGFADVGNRDEPWPFRSGGSETYRPSDI